MFDKQKTPLLTSFYKVRTLSDLSTNAIMTNKGTTLKVQAGDNYKKKMGPYSNWLMMPGIYL